MWWCTTLSAQSKVRPHPFCESCDGAWLSRLSPRSDLTLFLNMWWCVTLSAQSKVWPHPFENHVIVRDPLGSVQGPNSPFFWIMWWCMTLSTQSKVRPHPFCKSCDGVWPSQLSPRSNLTPFANHIVATGTAILKNLCFNKTEESPP